MSKKTFIILASIFAIFFLTAQACNFGGVSTGLAADCVGVGTVVCDGTEAYQCQLATYGVGFYVTRASGLDVSDCGAEASATAGADLTSYEYDMDRAEAKVATFHTRYTAAETAYNKAADAADYIAVTKLLNVLLTDISDEQTTVESISSDLAGEDQSDNDVLILESRADDLQSDLDTLETETTGLLDSVQTSLDSLKTTCGADTTNPDAECTGYRCNLKSGYCVFTCSTNKQCDSTKGYTCDTSTSTCGVSDSETVSCTDSDGGQDYDVYGQTIVTTDSKTTYYTESCSGSTLTEYYCSDDYTTAVTETYTCPSGTCTAGACVSSGTETSTVSCYDTDGGQDEFTKGTTYTAYPDGTVTFTVDDSCSTDNTKVTEYYCDSSSGIKSTSVACTYQCSAGACVSSSSGSGTSSSGSKFSVLNLSKTTTGKFAVAAVECNDGKDNDGDGNIDYPDDSGCISATDTKELGNMPAPAFSASNYTSDSKIPSDNLIFKLEDFSDGVSYSKRTTCITLKSSDHPHCYIYSSLTDESTYKTDAQHLEHAWMYLSESDLNGKRYFDFTKNTIAGVEISTDDEYVTFPAKTHLSPDSWIVVRADVRVASGHTSDTAMILRKDGVAKCTTHPLYEIYTKDGKYIFKVSVGKKQYSITSDTKVDTSWHQIVGIYDGSTVSLYVSGKKQSSTTISGSLDTGESSNDIGPLSFGINYECKGTPSPSNEYDFEGYLDDIYIWGE